MKPLLFAVSVVNYFRHIEVTKYSCEVFQEDFYTAEYGDICYVRGNEPLTWQDARDRCEASGGQVARLENSDVYDFALNSNNYIFRGKRDDTYLFVWIDGKKAGDKLYWTDGQLMTFSKPFVYRGLSLSEANCVLGTIELFEWRDCDETFAPFLCQHAKRPTPVKHEPLPTTDLVSIFPTYRTTLAAPDFLTKPTDMTSTNEPMTKITTSASTNIPYPSTELQRQLFFTGMARIGGNVNPKLKLKSNIAINTETLTGCGARCMSDNACVLINFYEESGKCRIYFDRDRALMAGADAVIGWKLYQRVWNYFDRHSTDGWN